MQDGESGGKAHGFRSFHQCMAKGTKAATFLQRGDSRWPMGIKKLMARGKAVKSQER